MIEQIGILLEKYIQLELIYKFQTMMRFLLRIQLIQLELDYL